MAEAETTPETFSDFATMTGLDRTTWQKCPECGKDTTSRGPCWDCDQAEQRTKDQARSMHRSRIPAAYQWITPGDEKLAKILRKPVEIVKARCVELLRDRRTVVTIQGTTGTGKTCLAVAMLVSRIEGALFVDSHTLAAAAAQHRLGQGEAPLVDRALRAKVLCLDEWRDPGTEPGRAVLERVVFDRVARGRKTLVTMPWSKEQVTKVYGEGMRRRLFDEAARAKLYTADEEKQRAEALAKAAAAQARGEGRRDAGPS